jgi:hypothetical protein
MTRGPKARQRNRSAYAIVDREAADEFKNAARRQRCAVCGRMWLSEGHHVIYQQELRHAAHEKGIEFESIRWDQRNLLPLCARCHTAHHQGHGRIPLRLVIAELPDIIYFAQEINRMWFLGRTYS